MRKFSDYVNDDEDDEIRIPEEEFEGELNFNDEKLDGGLADGMDLEDLAQKHGIDLDELEVEFEKGCKVEREHSYNKDIIGEIVRDHLFEDPYYYEKLATIESDSKDETDKEDSKDVEIVVFDFDDDMVCDKIK